MRLSYTKLSLYEFCPYAYRFRYIERIPIPFSPRLTVGAIVHSVLHRAFERLRDGVRLTRADLHELHAAYWRDAPRLTPRALPRHLGPRPRTPGRLLVRPRSRARPPRDAENAASASACVPDDNPHRPKAVIDRVDERSDGLEVIDYKSGSRPSELPGRLRTQLHTYRPFALERGFNSVVSRLTVYYLTDNQGISQSPDPAVADDVLNRYQALATRIGAADFTPTQWPALPLLRPTTTAVSTAGPEDSGRDEPG